MLLAIPLTIKFFLPIYSKLGIDTAYHYLELRFGSKGLRVLGAVMFIIYQVGRMAIIMYLPCMVLSKLMNVDVNVLILIMGVIAIIYSYTGGLKSVLWTDFIQGSVLLLGVSFALIFLLMHLDGGIGAIFNTFQEGKFLAENEPLFDPNILKTSVFLMIFGAGFNTISSYVSSQDIVQRFTTTTDTKKLNKMMLTNGALSIFIATVFYLIGTGLYIFYQQNPLPPYSAQDQIFASYIAYELPIGVTGILLAAIYAASQSTLSTGLNSVASSWTLDIQAVLSKKELGFEKETKIGQRVSLLVGIFAIIVAMVLANSGVTSAYEWFNGFMGLVLGILVGVFILGAFTRVSNTFGAVCAFVAASVVMVYVKYFVPTTEISIWAYSIISIGVSLVVGIPASIIWRKVKADTSVPAKNTTIFNAVQPKVHRTSDKYICLDIGGTFIKYGIVSRGGNIIFSDKCATEAQEGGPHILDKAVSLVDELSKKGDGEYAGVGISTAGMVDTKTGSIFDASDTIPNYAGTQFKKTIEDKFHLDCRVENDVNCAGLAEAKTGAAKNSKVAVALTVGTGVGGSLIVDGKVFHGFSESACEVGYMHIGGEDFQTQAAVSSLIKNVVAKKKEPQENWDGYKIFDAAKHGDKICIQAIDDMVDALAKGIANICYVVNPEVVVLGGGIMEQKEYLNDKVNEALKKYLKESVFEKTTIMFAENKNNAGILGAAFLFNE